MVLVQDSLGKAGGSGRKVDCAVIFFGNLHIGSLTGEIGHQLMIALGKGRAVVSYINQQAMPGKPVRIGLDTPDEGRAEHKDIHFRQLCAV